MTSTADPDDPTAMALPVIGERVRLTDGDEGTVMARSEARALAWRVQDGDPEHGTGWSRWVELHEIAGYPEAPSSTAPEPVAYLVAERRAGKWLIGDEWASEHDALDDARQHLKRFGGPSRGYTMGILAVTLVEEIQ